MRVRRRFSNACWAFLDDSLADLEGVLGEIRDQGGAGWSASGIRWVRHHRMRLRRAMRRRAATHSQSSVAACPTVGTPERPDPETAWTAVVGQGHRVAAGGRGSQRALHPVAIGRTGGRVPA